MPAEAESVYAPPVDVNDRGACNWYHTMEIPGEGVIEGQYDFRTGANDYLGNVDFKGKRVLEIGPATGFFTFYMEKLGADVVSVDLSPTDEWDVVPFARNGQKAFDDFMRQRVDNAKTLSNTWWYCHKRFNSKAKRVLTPVYNVPAAIGSCDIVTFCAVLLHFRDPFLALERALRLCTDQVIITDLDYKESRFTLRRKVPQLGFVPDPKRQIPYDLWWRVSPEAVKAIIQVLGFKVEQETHHKQPKLGRMVPFYTIVAKRTHAAVIPKGDYHL